MADKPALNRGPRGATGKTGATGRTGKQAVTPDAYLEKADELQRSLDGVRDEMARQTDEIEAANKTAREANESATRSKWASRFALVGVVLALAGLYGVWRQNVAIVATRTEARHTSCLRDNAIRYEAGEAAAKKAQDFIDANRKFYKTPPATGALLQAERDYVASQRQVTLDSYPRRDCTAAGIRAFYENPPHAPPEPTCVPDRKGLCR